MGARWLEILLRSPGSRCARSHVNAQSLAEEDRSLFEGIHHLRIQACYLTKLLDMFADVSQGLFSSQRTDPLVFVVTWAGTCFRALKTEVPRIPLPVTLFVTAAPSH